MAGCQRSRHAVPGLWFGTLVAIGHTVHGTVGKVRYNLGGPLRPEEEVWRLGRLWFDFLEWG